MPEVQAVDPGSEAAVEPLVGKGNGAIGVAVCRGEQGQPGTLGAGRAVAVFGGEAVQRLALPLGEDVVEPVGDTDAGVVVADLGLVVPEHCQPAVAAPAVPTHLA